MSHLKTIMTIEYNAGTNVYICSDGTFTGEFDSLQEIFDIDDSDYLSNLEKECQEFRKEYNNQNN